MPDHSQYMQKCLELARLASGRTSPNPLVGSCVVSTDGKVISTGFHKKAGQAHAEVEALDQAGEAARGQILYVNLEPCCHHGRTGPCSQRVIASGVKQVVVGTLDPNPKVSGKGIQQLRDAGIDVVVGVDEKDCRYLNRAFIKWITTGKPWLCLKMASTADGKIADRTGTSRWITGPQARQFVHELRNVYDCVLVGAGTLSADDPQLLVRDLEPCRQPVRAVIAGKATVNGKERIFKGLDDGGADIPETLIFTCSQDAQAANLPAKVVTCAANALGAGVELTEVLSRLGQRGILSVLCEGGARLAGALLSQRLVDEAIWIIAPKFLPDGQARPVTQGAETVLLADAVPLTDFSWRQLGCDLVLQGLVADDKTLQEV